MTPQISVRPAAIKEIDEAADYIAQDNPPAARRFYAQVATTLEELAASPGTGAPRRTRAPKLKGLRFRPVAGFKKYLVFYLPIKGGGIDVLHVVHGARDVERILNSDE